MRYRWGVVALGVVAGDIEMGRGSPRRGSREIEEEIEKDNRMLLIGYIKVHNPKSRCGNLSNT